MRRDTFLKSLAALAAAGYDVRAGEHYRRAAELAPTRGAVLNNYGAWICAQGRAVESLAWFDRALAAPYTQDMHGSEALGPVYFGVVQYIVYNFQQAIATVPYRFYIITLYLV